MSTVSIIGALLAGVFSLLSPCSALLLPAFFAYAFSAKTQLLWRTFVFYLGLVTILIPIGSGAGLIGAWLSTHRQSVILLGGVLVIIFGALILCGGGFALPGSDKLTQRAARLGNHWLGTYVLGIVYGFAGFCAGPLLGAVISTAVISGSSLHGILIMTCYAAGMTVPLIILAAAWDSWSIGERSWFHTRSFSLWGRDMNLMSTITGCLFIVLGLFYIASGATSRIGGLLHASTQARIEYVVLLASQRLSLVDALFFVLVVAECVLLAKILHRSR